MDYPVKIVHIRIGGIRVGNHHQNNRKNNRHVHEVGEGDQIPCLKPQWNGCGNISKTDQNRPGIKTA